MPYNIVKVRSGFKVQDDKGRFYSKKLLTKNEAREQQKALYAMERRKAIDHHPDGRMDFTYRKKKHELKGTGFFSDMWNMVRKAGKSVVAVGKKVAPIAKHIQQNIGTYASIGRQLSDVLVPAKLSPPVEKWLEENGSGVVQRLTLRRAPIESWIEFFFSLVTDGKWDEAKKTAGYDKMFHLALQVEYRLPDGTIKQSKMEKLSRVSFSDDVSTQPNLETQEVALGGKTFTILEMVEGAKRILGDKFYTYDAFSNNCQVFVRSLLEGVGLYTPEAKAFVFQPVDELLKEQPAWTSDFSRTITNLGAITDRLFKGGNRKRMLQGSSANKKTVTMPLQKFLDEHKNLIHLLRNPDPAKLKAEADEQEAEVKQYTGGGFVLKKERRETDNATFWVVRDTYTNKIVFRSRKLADAIRKKEELSQERPSPLTLPPRERPESPPDDVIAVRPSDKSAPFKVFGKGRRSFQEELKTLGIDPQKYLKEAQKRARSAGYSHLPQFSSKASHKLEVVSPSGKIVRFGRTGYGDNIVYTFHEALGKIPKGTADTKRKAYLARATKIKGDWKADDYSPNSLAIRILWSG
jgi:hypothetical protein